MNALIICRVIDNFGDAGFCLRLARRLAFMGHTATVLTDKLSRFTQLKEQPMPLELALIEVNSPAELNRWADGQQPELVLDCFGSSGDEDSPIKNEPLQRAWPNCLWLTVDYLSAEKWVEDFHLIASVNQGTGFRSRYFYPGFTGKTGGLIHGDAPAVRPTQSLNKVFAFCYGQIHADLLESALSGSQSKTVQLSVPFPAEESTATLGTSSLLSVPASTQKTSRTAQCDQNSRLVKQPDGQTSRQKDFRRVNCDFVPQIEFDALLADHDFLFVRGEDSFVRAQLSGRPLVWQIYAVEDQTHWTKLNAFFELYSEELSKPAKDNLWRLWTAWNQPQPSQDALKSAWADVEADFEELSRHAFNWQSKLKDGPELVREILTLALEFALNQ